MSYIYLSIYFYPYCVRACCDSFCFCFPEVWACWWHGCPTPTTLTSWWWASWTSWHPKAPWRICAAQTRTSPLWLRRRARPVKCEWLSAWPRLQAETAKATICALKLGLICFLFVCLFLFLPRSSVGSGNTTSTKAKFKRKGAFGGKYRWF